MVRNHTSAMTFKQNSFGINRPSVCQENISQNIPLAAAHEAGQVQGFMMLMLGFGK